MTLSMSNLNFIAEIVSRGMVLTGTVSVEIVKAIDSEVFTLNCYDVASDYIGCISNDKGYFSESN